MNKRLLITGASGLIGSEVCRYFGAQGWEVHGIDNNQRADFFGPSGDTLWNRQRLASELQSYAHYGIDIRDRGALLKTFKAVGPDAIVHAAAQPSHDLAASIPFEDFDTNAVGTFNMLEAARQFAPEAPFVHLSTNKVYGDRPNNIDLVELETRYDFSDSLYCTGIGESMSIDQCKHSLFGASKVAADIAVQEYGRYFGMPTCCLRGGCLTGPAHSGVELHGFLSYLAKQNMTEGTYRVYGYKGKQVRDNIHSEDVARFIMAFVANPQCGEVYNIGGGKKNTCSLLEAFSAISEMSGKAMRTEYVDQPREGDHICYYSDLQKAQSHYPEWSVTISLQQIYEQIVESWLERLSC